MDKKSISSDCSFITALVIKPSNIRIWIHDKDIDKLMRVVLEGHGQKLRNEVASHAKVKKFLEYVPHFMGLFKSIHTAVIDNNIEYLQAKTSPPVPPQMLNCKDVNGLTPLHKGLLIFSTFLQFQCNIYINTYILFTSKLRALHILKSLNTYLPFGQTPQQKLTTQEKTLFIMQQA